MNIPIVNLSAVCEKSPSRDDWLVTAKEFGKALETIGFVYLSHHGISQDKIESVFQESRKFFQLDEKLKLNYKRDFESTFHGYTQVGGELMTLDTDLELREMFDAALADIGEFSSCPYPDDDVPEFRVTMKAMMKECQETVFKLLRLLALALELEDEDYFVKCHNNINNSSIPNFTQLRTLFYPKVDKPITANTVRCAAHSDYGTITLLFQDSIGGLQIKSLDGSWIPAKPIPGCILINVGDLLDIWTGGRFPSTIHRVVIPEEEIKRKTERQSVALFVKPDNSTLVFPLLKDAQDAKKNQANAELGVHLPEKVYAGQHFQARTVYHHKISAAARG